MATAVATAVVRFEAIEVAVEVTTDCMPPMSLVMRDCTSPVRVRVKKPIDWRCRWAKTSVRSAVHDLLAELVLIQVCTTPSTAVTAATASMPATSQSSRVRSCSRQGRVDHGAQQERRGHRDDDGRHDDRGHDGSGRRCAVNSAPMRRSDTSRACGLLGGGDGAAGAAGRDRGGWTSKGALLCRVNLLRLPHHEGTTGSLLRYSRGRARDPASGRGRRGLADGVLGRRPAAAARPSASWRRGTSPPGRRGRSAC